MALRRGGAGGAGPHADEQVRKALDGLDFATRKRLLQDNAAELYRTAV